MYIPSKNDEFYLFHYKIESNLGTNREWLLERFNPTPYKFSNLVNCLLTMHSFVYNFFVFFVFMFSYLFLNIGTILRAKIF